MKKCLLIAGGVSMFLFNACKEIGPSIDFTPNVVDTSFKERAYDTSYIITAPPAEPKKVLVEEYTGVQCPNCPAGSAILKQYDSTNPGKIVIVALHSGALTSPIQGMSKYNFSNQDVQNMVNGYLGGNTPPKPAAAIDRVRHGDMFVTNRNQWTTYIGERSIVATPVNISIESRYDTAFKKVVIKVRLVYTQAVTKKQNLSLWVTESNIIDAQLSESTYIPDYVHNHIFRDFITPINGSSILPGIQKVSGLVYERQFIYEPKFLNDQKLDRWNLDNCDIVAVVHNDEFMDNEVSQVAQTELK